MLTNGGFEDELIGWYRSYAQSSVVHEVDRQIFRSGGASLKLSSSDATQRASLYQSVKLTQAGIEYTIEFSRKMDRVEAPGAGGAYLRVTFHGESGDRTREALYVGMDTGTGTRDWFATRETFFVPEGTARLTIDLFLVDSTGTVWWDDLSLIPEHEADKSAWQIELERRFPPIEPGQIPDWMAHPVAMEALDPDTVLKPWTPVEVSEDSVFVWGRRYDLGDWGLPAQVMSAQAQILAGPVRLEIVAAGETEALAPEKARLLDQHKGRVRWVSAAQADLVQAEMVAAYEYDGFSRFDLSLASTQTSSVDRMELVIPIKPEHAKLLHYIDAVPPGESLRGRSYSGALPEGEGVVLEVGFKVMVWIGDHERGIAWFSESDQYWWPFRDERAIRIVRQDDRVELRIGIMSAPGSPLPQKARLSFGLMATPVKPMPQGWRNFRFVEYNAGRYNPKLHPNIERHSIHWYSNWHIVEQYPVPRDWQAFKEQFDNERMRGTVRSYPYLDVTLLSRANTVLIPGENFIFTPPEYAAFGRQWEITPSSTSPYLARVSVASAWADFALAVVKEWIEKAGATGIYLDESFPRADLGPQNGMGYVDHLGRRQPTYALYATRDFYKRLAYLFQEYADGPPALIAHSSARWAVPYLSFADVMLDGEHLEPRINDWPGPDDPSYMELVPLDEWQAQFMGKQFGLVPVLLPQLKDTVDRRFPGIRVRTEPTRDMLAMALLHDMHVWAIWSNPQVISRAYAALSDFNTGADDVTYHPYWEIDSGDWIEGEGVLVSYYRRPGSLLAVIVNTKPAAQDVTLDWTRILGPVRVEQAMDVETFFAVSMQSGRMKVAVGGRDFKLVTLRFEPCGCEEISQGEGGR